MVEPNKVIQGVKMDENSNKIRMGFYLEKELLDECNYFLLHIMCIDEVRKINGIITYDSAARFQRDD